MATFATLKADIAAWMRRGDLTSVIPSLVALAETEIFQTHNTPLRVREMETTATLTVTDLIATVPDDYLDGRYIKLANETVLNYLPANDWNSSKYSFYTVVGRTIMLPTGRSGDLTLVYWARPANLAVDADTNSVLNAYYGAYLKAALKQALLYVKDGAAAVVAQQELDAILSGANSKPVIAGSLQVRAG